MSIKLTSVNVQKIFNECLGEGDESIVIKPAIASPSFCKKYRKLNFLKNGQNIREPESQTEETAGTC